MKSIIETLPFRSESKLTREILKQNPTSDKKQIRKHIRKRLHDIKPKNSKAYYYRIFSSSPHSYMHDLLENPKSDKINPPYFHIFLNTNTRFAVAYPLQSKTSSSIHHSLKKFIETYHPSKLTSDSEPSFLSNENINLLKSSNVQQLIIQDLIHNHSSLSLMDRFIRTLRDMNQPVPSSKNESTHQEFKSFSIPTMNKLIKIYNNTYHSSIKTEPIIMQSNPQLETDYIFKMSEHRLNQERISDFHLPIHSFVRYQLPHIPNQKKRTHYSSEAYKIDSRNGNLYNISAQDGTVMTLPRFKLRLCHKSGKLSKNIKFARTIPDRWNGTIDKIISYNPSTKKYRVSFTVPNQQSIIDEIPLINLRGKYPHLISEIESEFHKSQ